MQILLQSILTIVMAAVFRPRHIPIEIISLTSDSSETENEMMAWRLIADHGQVRLFWFTPPECKEANLES